MSVTYYVALPFVDSEEGPRPAQAEECLSEVMAKMRAEGLARRPEYVGALAFKRTGLPNEGHFGEPTISGRLGWCRRAWTSFRLLTNLPRIQVWPFRRILLQVAMSPFISPIPHLGFKDSVRQFSDAWVFDVRSVARHDRNRVMGDHRFHVGYYLR